MRPETVSLLQVHPLMEGEDVVAELAGTDTTGNVEVVILTPTRIGAWHSGPPFLCPLYMVADWSVEGSVVRIRWDNDVEHMVDTESPEEASEFYRILLALRRGVMRPECTRALSIALPAVADGEMPTAVEALHVAVDSEPFHPAPALLLYQLYRWFGDRKAAMSALTRVIAPAVEQTPVSVFLWVGAPFTAIDFHVSASNLGIEGPVECWSHAQVLFAAVREARAGNMAQSEQYIQIAVSACTENVALAPLTLLFAASLLPAPRWEGLRATATRLRAMPTAQELRELFDLVEGTLQYPTDPIAAADAMIAYADANGGPLDGSALRVLQRWQDVHVPVGLPDLDPADIGAMSVSEDACERVRDWLAAHFDPARDVERMWACLRLDALEDAQGYLLPQPGEWYRTIAEAFPREACEPWLAGLAETELLLRSGRTHEATALLDVVYRERVATFGDARDLYTRHATHLYGLYASVLGGRGADARMYARLLEGEVGFGWVGGVAALVPAEPAPAAWAMQDFEAWVTRVTPALHLTTSRTFRDAVAQFGRARRDRSLRVVIGGETSAGKSSFINALLGENVLFVTEEEATAIPTSLRRGARWAAEVERHGEPHDQLNIGPNPSEADRKRLHAWVRRFTAVGSPDNEGITGVTITVPTGAIPEGVTYIDTPGLNAHSLRTERAQRAIEEAHACVFVVDAGSALKAKEMAKIRWAASEVGKTIFVLNKMDKALGDPDLDCDEDAVGDLLARMREELTKSLGAEPIIYGVCSLPEATVRVKAPEALPFVRNVPEVRRKLAETLKGSWERLVNRSAAKVARVAAGEALARAAAGVGSFESEVGRLVQRLPDDPDTFREHVSHLTSTVWTQSRSRYIERMQAEVGAAGDRCMERVVAGMNGCQNREQLNAFVQTRVRGIFNSFVTDVDAARAQEWATLGKAMLVDVQELFQALYADAKFTPDFETGNMLHLATPIPLAQSVSSLTDSVNTLINAAGANEVGGAAIGAIIGTILFPGIGTIIGGALGSAAGGSMNEDVPRKVYEQIHARFSEIYDVVIDALNRDIAPDGDRNPPILVAIDDVVESERLRFERVLRREIARIEREKTRALHLAEGARVHVSEAAVWMGRFDAMVRDS